MNTSTSSRKRAARAVLALALMMGTTPFVGCAETSRTEVRRTSVDSGPGGDGTREREVVERTTVVQDAPDSCDGILSCTVDFAGDVIAFPFKLVGGVFKALF